MDPISRPEDAAFRPTRPSLVALVARRDEPGYREAWESFFRDYWPPLHAYLVRSGSPREEARDILQDFFVRGLEGKFLDRFDPSRGRFRTFLLACLANHRRQAIRKDRSRPERRAAAFLESIDADPRLGVEPAADAEAAFEAEWMRRIGERARAALEARFEERGDSIHRRLLAEWVLAAERPPGAALARELGISPGDLYVRATRLRQAFAVEVEREVRAWTDETAAERDEVLRALLEPGGSA